MHHAAFSPNGRRVVTASSDGTGLGRGLGPADSPPMDHTEDGVVQAVFSPDGRRVLTLTIGRDQTARLWDAGSGQPITPLLKHEGFVTQGGVQPRRPIAVVTAGADKTARVWDAASGGPADFPANASCGAK